MKYNKENLLNEETLNSLRELGSSDGKLFFLEIINLFLSESEKIMSKIDSQIKGKIFNELRISAHTLKGASANVGAVKLSELSSKMEEKAKLLDGINLEELHSELKKCYVLTRIELENLIS
jgi:HPt (histidine-containing phosphotransfer) domain-containing protein